MSRFIKYTIVIALLVSLFIALKTLPVVPKLLELIGWVEGLGAVGYLIFIAIYILLTILAGPAWALTMAAGFVYGLWKGTLLVSAGSILGASLSFLIGRYLARDAIARKVENNPRFESIDRAVGERGFFIVFLTRLSPVFPFTLLNYAYGLTKVSLPSYFFASWIGMLPGTVMYVYLGTLITNLSQVAGGEVPDSSARTYLYYLGLVATVAVTVYITKIARRALLNTCPDGEGDKLSFFEPQRRRERREKNRLNF